MIERRQFLKVVACTAGAAAALPDEAEAREARPMPTGALGLLYDGTLCIGCRACIKACKEANNMPPEHTALNVGNYWDAPLDISGKTLNVITAYRSGTAEHKDQVTDGFAFSKTSCMHCVDPSCVSACPVSAMTKDPVTGVVHYSVDACIGCRYCVAACPFGVPRFSFDEVYPKISKCQLCEHRLADGKYAACAEACPTGATLYGKVADLREEVARRRALAPGTPTVFPRGRLGGPDQSYAGTVSEYVPQTYGEKEIGGTQVLHLSGVPFALLNKPALPDIAPARTAETLQHTIYNGLIAPLVFLTGLLAMAYRNMRGAGPPDAKSDPPQRGTP
jgi:Fe-S-cluster-containing dehydrogenase component